MRMNSGRVDPRSHTMLVVATLLLLAGVLSAATAPAGAQDAPEASAATQTVSVVERVPLALEPAPGDETPTAGSDTPDPTGTAGDAGRAAEPDPATVPGTTPGSAPAGAEAPTTLGDRAVLRETDLEDFRMIALSVESMLEGPILIRVHAPDTGWRPWFEVEFEDQVGPDQGSVEGSSASQSGRRVTEAVWVDHADGFEMNVAASTVGAEASLVRDRVEPAAADAGESADAGSAPGPGTPGINLRSSWGARAPKVEPEIAPSVRIGVVHHTVSENSYHPDAVPGILRATQAYHMDDPDHRWNDIGYNFLIDAYGRIWEGRGGGITNAVIGAHAVGANAFGTGVSVIGNLEVAVPPPAVIDSLGVLLGWKLNLHGVEAGGRVDFPLGAGALGGGRVVNLPTIIGHRDVAQTACPGIYLYNQLGSVRARAASHQAAIRASQGFWSSMTIGRNADGRLELFAIGNNGQLYHNWQGANYLGWSGWYSMGGNFAGSTTVAANADGRLEVFAISTTGRLYHSWQLGPNAPWSALTDMGGTFSPDAGVGVARGGGGRLEAVVIGSTQAWVLHQVAPNSFWSGADPIGGSFPSNAGVTATVNADGRIEVFAVADGNQLVHSWQRGPEGRGGWSAFTPLGMWVSGKPSVAANADGRLEVVGVGPDGLMRQSWQYSPNGIWSGHRILAGGLGADADSKIARNADGRLQIFSLAWSGELVSAWQQGAGSIWTGTHGFGGKLMGSVDVGMRGDGRMMLASFTSPYADRAWTLTQNSPNGTWGVWTPTAY